MPDDKAQRNFTDPDSRIMPGPGGRDFQQSYNCQAVVDSSHQVIVAARATDQPSDKRQAVVMVEETIGNVGAVPIPPTPGTTRPSGGWAIRPGSGPVRRAGEDPPRPGVGASAPGPHTPGPLTQGPDAPQAAYEALRAQDGDGGTGVRPDQAGPGLPAVPAAGPGES